MRSGHLNLAAHPVSVTGVRRVIVLAGEGESHLGARPRATLTLSIRAFTLSLCDSGAEVAPATKFGGRSCSEPHVVQQRD